MINLKTQDAIDVSDDVVKSRFFKSRTVIVAGEINHTLAEKTVKHLIALSEDSDDPINMFISSPGGHVESGDMVHDMIRFIRPKVRTIGSGWVASAGALIYVGAQKENRIAYQTRAFCCINPAMELEDRPAIWRYKQSKFVRCGHDLIICFQRQRDRAKLKSPKIHSVIFGLQLTRRSAMALCIRS